MANSGPYGGGYQGYAGQSYAGYGSDIVPPSATPNPRDAADCAYKRPKYPGWLCPLHVDTRLSLASLAGHATQFAPHRRGGPSLRFRRSKGSSQI